MKRKGVGLVEVLVSSLILVIVVSGVMVTYANSSKLVMENRKKNIAIKYINNAVETFNSITDASTIYPDSWDFPYKDENGNITNFTVELTTENYSSFSSLLQLNFEIKWDGHSLKRVLISNPGLN